MILQAVNLKVGLLASCTFTMPILDIENDFDPTSTHQLARLEINTDKNISLPERTYFFQKLID